MLGVGSGRSNKRTRRPKKIALMQGQAPKTRLPQSDGTWTQQEAWIVPISILQHRNHTQEQEKQRATKKHSRQRQPSSRNGTMQETTTSKRTRATTMRRRNTQVQLRSRTWQ